MNTESITTTGTSRARIRYGFDVIDGMQADIDRQLLKTAGRLAATILLLIPGAMLFTLSSLNGSILCVLGALALTAAGCVFGVLTLLSVFILDKRRIALDRWRRQMRRELKHRREG